MSKKVTIFTTPTCHFCHEAKDYFKKNNITFDEHDVSTDAKSRDEMIKETGSMAVPVIKIGDKTIIGFDKGAIEKALEE
ncbi:NrdH-redoxin [archaeon]|nr:NrdH-redoxin [archaeon]|tara:strand:+ start:767 stop:1003 length:237 start_codon:yes stop_codon:yes gene_type:complete